MINTKSKAIKNNLISVTTDFETGAGIDLQFLNKKSIRLYTPSDPVTSNYTKGYDYYFHVAIKNNSENSLGVTLEILRPDTKVDQLDWSPSKAPILCSDDNREWYLLPNVQAANEHRDYKCFIEIAMGQTIQVSNNTPIHPSTVEKKLNSIQKSNDDKTKYIEIGRSVNGLPILLLEIDESPKIEKDRFLIWSGIHPSEPDTVAAFWVIEWLLSNDPIALKARRDFIFEVIPMINPDGFIIGTSGCNANGVNIFWDFKKNHLKESPESTSLWSWIQKRTPNVAIDLHAYIYQVYKKRRPYIGKVGAYPRNFRKAAWDLHSAIMTLSNGEVINGKTAENETSLAPHLINNFGTLTLPGYHFHLADGPELSKKFIIETIITITSVTKKYQPLRKIKITDKDTIDYNSALWSIFELTVDRLPRRLRGYSKRIRNLFLKNKAKRPDIDNSKEWRAHNYLHSKKKPVVTISKESIK